MSEQMASAPLAPARHARILAALAQDGSVRSSELIDELGVTPVTLRRDLAQLENEGRLRRVHGGAVQPPGAHTRGALDAPPARGHEGGVIAVLVPSLNYYWPSVVRGIESEAHRHGFTVQVRAASYEMQDERPVLERLIRAEGVRGLIVAPNTDTERASDVVDWLQGCGVASVLAEREAPARAGGLPVESVVTDHALGGILAARHLAELGHEKVGLVVAQESPTSRKIAAGWYTACRDLNLAPTQHFETLLPPRSSPDFSAAVDKTLDKALALGMTGLLVHADPEAMAFVDLAMNRDLSVPGDLSIMSYDDEVAEQFTPRLTAIRPPREAVGAAAADLLLRRIHDPSRVVHRISLNPSLEVRESTAPPRSVAGAGSAAR